MIFIFKFLKTKVSHIVSAILLVVAVLCTSQNLHAQYFLQGTVFDSTIRTPVLHVEVNTKSGKKVLTNGDGRYTIPITTTDSVWFVYGNKSTRKFAVKNIKDFSKFDISIKVTIPVLQEVKVFPRSYRLDSMANRQEYAKIFNYEPANFSSIVVGAGINIDELIRLFQFRKNKAMLSFQQRLINDEKDMFIDRRFNKRLVRQLTQLDSTYLEKYMMQYRPTLEMATLYTDYNFNLYIKITGEEFRRKYNLPPNPNSD